jgi:ABC-2 type transport system permease protein
VIRAFGYLLGRSARNRLVRQLRRLRQPRYFVALVLGLAYLWFLVLRQSPRASEAGPLEARWVELIAALGVAGAIAWAWLFGSERRALAFTPAELTFLFPAPVTRRQLIHFKLLRNQLIILLNTAIWTFVLSRERFGASTWRHAAAVWVLLTTLSLHRLGASFVRSTLADHGLEGVRRRLLTLVVVFVVLAGAALVVHDAYALVGAGWHAGVGPFVSSLGTALETPVARLLLWPFHAMSGPLTAPTASDWLTAMIPAVVLLVLHYLWVLQSDAAFEEVAAQASLKRAQAVLDRSQMSRPRRFVHRDPPPYRLTPVGSQAGAILWKNLVGVWRTGRPRAVALGLIVAGALLAVLSFRTGSTVAEIVGWFAAMWAGFLLVIGPQWIRSDLRSDMPSLDLLRSYPLPGRSVITGEVAASTLVVSALQLGVLTVAYLAFLGNRVMEPGLALRTAALAAGFVLLPVINLLGVLIHNAAVILYPAWLGLASGRPAGVEALGQNMLAIMGYLILLACALALPAGAGAAVFFALEPSIGWLAAAALAIVPGLAVAGAEVRLMIGWIGRAFDRTDPATAGITS